MQEKWLPGNTMDRIRDLCRSRNITQVELAQAVGMDKSTLSRVMAEKTSKLSSKNLVAIANYFEVSTDFLLGLTDIPARKEHDIERLGLSVEAAANLHQGKLNHSVVCQLLENPKFAELTRQIALYQEGVLASGVAAQNQMYNSMSSLMLEHGQANPEDMSAVRGAVQEAQALKRPVYADEIEKTFREYEIPVFMDYKRNVLLNSFVEYIRSLLAMAEQKFSAESVFRFLRTDLVGFTGEELDLLENYVLALGIRGYKKWQEKWIRRAKDTTEEELEVLNHLRVCFVEKTEDLVFVLKQRQKTVRDVTLAICEFLEKKKSRSR